MKTNKMYLVVLLICSTIFSGCMKTNADLIVTNGNIYTVDTAFSKVEAFAVKDGLFAAVGSTDKILSLYKSENVINLHGVTVYPGFFDAHCHLFLLGKGLMNVDLRGASSFDEIVDRLKIAYKKNPVPFLIGEGWDQNTWKDTSMPTNDKLNKAFPNIPVILYRVDYHAILINNAAIANAKVTDNNTGLYIDEFEKQIENSVPLPIDTQLHEIVARAQKECFKYGLTSVSDAGEEYEELMILDSMNKSGALKIRVDAYMYPTEENFKKYDKPYNYRRLRVSCIKLFQDGALGSRGAYLLNPYSDEPNTRGIQVISDEDFRSLLRWAYEHGFQVATHCIGDAANRAALDMYSELLTGSNDRRWRIEHCQVIDSADMYKFGKYSIIPSVQPTHCTSDMLWAGDRLGNRIVNAYPYKQLLNQFGWIPCGTDFPVENVNPVRTFFAAVFRKNSDNIPPAGFQMENSLTKEEALRSMTIWPAKAMFGDMNKGSIEVGKYADFIITDRDIMTVPEKDVMNTKIIETYVGGESVYKAN